MPLHWLANLALHMQATIIIPQGAALATMSSDVGRYSILTVVLSTILYTTTAHEHGVEHSLWLLLYGLAALHACFLINYNVADRAVDRAVLLAFLANAVLKIAWYAILNYEHFSQPWVKEKAHWDLVIGALKVVTSLNMYRCFVELAFAKLRSPRRNLFVTHEYLLLPLDAPTPSRRVERKPFMRSTVRSAPSDHQLSAVIAAPIVSRSGCAPLVLNSVSSL